MWCTDPDKAFDIGCPYLCSEDWCHDESNCKLKRKDKSMFISIKKNLELMDEMDNSVAVIQISKDKKKFSVLKHDSFKDSEGKEYHMSDLKNILLAGR